MYHVKSGVVTLRDGSVEYIRFGTGPQKLVMLPGLGTSLRSIRGTALPMALLYRSFAREYTVWAFNRKAPLAEGATTRSMAQDVALAMGKLGIERADILGVSMGGMIAQWLAIDFPDRVGKLVLTVTCARPNAVLREAVGEWMDCARRGDHVGFLDSNLRRIYSEDYCRRNRWLMPLVGLVTKPGSYAPFLRQAEACLAHEAYDALPRIRAKTLVLGGEQDKSLGGEASREIAARIPGAALRMYRQWGHGLYEEEKTFNEMVLAFLKA